MTTTYVAEIELPMDWFERHLPGSANRIRAGASLGLNEVNLAEYALQPASTMPAVALPEGLGSFALG